MSAFYIYQPVLQYFLSQKVQIRSEVVFKYQAYVTECLMILMFGLREVF